MKRLGLMIAILIVMAGEGYAQEDKWMQDATFKRLQASLQLYPEQMEEVYVIYDYFVNQLRQPLSCEAVFNNDRSADIQNALVGHLKLMRRVLTTEQYRKYVRILDASRSHIQNDISNPELKRYLAVK